MAGPGFDLTAIGFPADVAEVVTAVVAGTTGPEAGAGRLAGMWVAAEELGGGPPARSRGSIASLNQLANELMLAGRTAEGRRLAELNWILARRAADEDAAVACAATLAQLIGTGPDGAGQRLELLEYAVPAIVASGRPALAKAVMLAHLAEARYNAAGGDSGALAAAVDASRQALAADADIGDFWRANLHFMAGTALQSLGDLTDGQPGDDRYRESVAELSRVLDYFGPQRNPGAYAAALSNLGNSYRKLGARTGDAALVRKAIGCFDTSLPYRAEPALRASTQANRAVAARLADTLAVTARAVPGTGAEAGAEAGTSAETIARARAYLEAGDAALTEMRAGRGEDAALRRRAAGQFLAAARLAGRDSPASLRADVQHRLTLEFVTATDDDALWTGACFAAAARRLGGADQAPLRGGRLDFHLGFMLMKIGLPDQLPYLRRARELLAAALPPLAAAGVTAEHDFAARLHAECLALLAPLGDGEADLTTSGTEG
ncbi:MAG TPA: hypothetical protein VH478_03130 [Trebonia sp.]|jgi:hypothetical protein|nr:hypothetical protein [Trebonia sp.]